MIISNYSFLDIILFLRYAGLRRGVFSIFCIWPTKYKLPYIQKYTKITSKIDLFQKNGGFQAPAAHVTPSFTL